MGRSGKSKGHREKKRKHRRKDKKRKTEEKSITETEIETEDIWKYTPIHPKPQITIKLNPSIRVNAIQAEEDEEEEIEKNISTREIVRRKETGKHGNETKRNKDSDSPEIKLWGEIPPLSRPRVPIRVLREKKRFNDAKTRKFLFSVLPIKRSKGVDKETEGNIATNKNEIFEHIEAEKNEGDRQRHSHSRKTYVYRLQDPVMRNILELKSYMALIRKKKVHVGRKRKIKKKKEPVAKPPEIEYPILPKKTTRKILRCNATSSDIVQKRSTFPEAAIRAMLKKSLYALLSHAGFHDLENHAMEVFTDVVIELYTIIFNEMHSNIPEYPRVSSSVYLLEALGRSFIDIWIGNFADILLYYEERILKFRNFLFKVAEKTYNKYMEEPKEQEMHPVLGRVSKSSQATFHKSQKRRKKDVYTSTQYGINLIDGTEQGMELNNEIVSHDNLQYSADEISEDSDYSDAEYTWEASPYRNQPSNRLSKVNQIFGRKYQLDKIANGSFCEVYVGTDLETDEMVTIKLEPVKVLEQYVSENFRTILPHEHALYVVLQGGNAVPNLRWYGQDKEYNILVMDMMGPSLEDLFELLKKFTIKTVLLLVDQMLLSLEFMHGKEYIHGNIKPSSFRMGQGINANNLFLVNYKLARSFKDAQSGNDFTPLAECSMSTVCFSSINTHTNSNLGPKDDLESLGYVLVYLCKGSLPWYEVRTTHKMQRLEKMLDIKMSTSIADLCKGLPMEFAVYMDYCCKLNYDEVPNYNYLKELFLNLFRFSNFNDDNSFDWSAR